MNLERLGLRGRICIALGVFVVTAGTAAGVFAVGRVGGATVVDRTIACPTAALSHDVLLGASVQRATALGTMFPPNIGGVGATAVGGIIFAEANGVAKGGYTFNHHACRPAARIPLMHVGLREVANLAGTGGQHVGWTCSLAAVVTVRLQVTVTASGKASAAKLVLSSAEKTRAFVDWTPARVRVWATPACRPQTQ